MTTDKKLTSREAMFCRYLSALGDPYEAAVLAGYGGDSRKQAAQLITRTDITRECETLAKNMPHPALSALRGLERIAFGGIGDALRLLYIDEAPDPSFLQELDLFCISEIKRPKGGGIEIKFHDRTKALLALLEHEEQTETPGAASLYQALENSAYRAGDLDDN